MKRSSKPKIIMFLLIMLMVLMESTMALIITEPQSIKNTFKPFSFPLNDLIVSKTVNHPFGDDYVIPSDLAFDFEVDFGTEYANYTFDTNKGSITANELGIINIKLRHSETFKVGNVPEGTKVKVTEIQNKPGFSLKEASATREGIISSDNTLEMAYTNYYKAEKVIPANITITGTKILEGREWQENDTFAFTLEFQSETGEWITLATKTTTYNAENSDYNKFDFSDVMPNLEFSKIGNYNFRIIEVIGNAENVVYDETKNFFNIEVTDKTMDGKLEINDVKGYQNITITKSEETAETYNVDVVFNNKYDVVEVEKLNIDVSGIVKVENTGELTIGPENFEIILTNTQNNEEIKLVTDIEGKVDFDLLFTKEDVGKTFEYIIKQTNDGRENVIYSTNEYKVQIQITLNENNELIPKIIVNEVEAEKILAEFTNIYHANPVVIPDDISIDIKINKTINNTGTQLITPENFEFVLENTTTNEQTIVKTDKDGKASIKLDYTNEDIGKTYKYTLKEINTEIEGVTYSSKNYNIEVTISLSEDNKLIPTITVNGEIVQEIVTEFINFYNIDPPEDISIDVEINKTINNIGDIKIDPSGFEFILENTTTKETNKVKTDKNGKAIIKLDYNSEDIGKVYYYTLKEINTNVENVTYSTYIYDIKAEITLSEENKLIATTSLNNKQVDRIIATFENIYEKYAIKDLEVDVIVNNKVDNTGKYSIGPENFEFLLQNITTGENRKLISDKDGNANTKLIFTENDIGKTYKYKLNLVKGKIPGLNYSEEVYDIEIAITLDENHKLVATININGQVLNSIVASFMNVYYVAPETPTLPPTLDVTDNTPYIRTMIITAGGLMLVLLLQSQQYTKDYFATAINTTRIVPTPEYKDKLIEEEHTQEKIEQKSSLKSICSKKAKVEVSSDEIYEKIMAKRNRKTTK